MPTNTEMHQLHKPAVSVIIPTLNAGKTLLELLVRLQRQTLAPHEIIVIDSSSEDGTPQLAAEQGATVLHVERTEFDHGGTRNRAAERATGDVLVFMTQDALPADDTLLERLVEPLLGSERISSSYARQLPYPDANPIERMARAHNYPAEPSVKSKADLPRLGIRTFFCSNVCAAVKRDVFERMGRFESPVIFNEDLFMAADCILAGYEVAYAADAAVYHSHNYSAVQQLRRFFDNGVSMRRNERVQPYSAIGGAGSSLVKLQLAALAREKQWRWIPKLIAESAAKLIGFKLGYHYRKLPAALCRKLSMHKLIWDKLEREQRGTGAGLPG
ncbi:glycosyltransferase family 2 protein [Paenibacillus thailandensis]|uniref:Glycosyltransferase family 2 protein n=1 Tax=Paenibacillus thailandensis TaxID=393250 RepID=A0ABW5QTI6_9BACL